MTQLHPARLATTRDVFLVADLLDQFNIEFEYPSLGKAFLVTRLTNLLDHPQVLVVVAGDPPQGVGIVTLRPLIWEEGLVATIDELYTAPSMRSQGLGTAMLMLITEQARHRGARYLNIQTDEHDEDAHRFYARHGYPIRDKETGECAYSIWKAL